jgi:hypothetical protein
VASVGLKAYTDIELEAARRRELISSQLLHARVAGDGRTRERRSGSLDRAWLAASAAIATGARLVRG